jgi:hypothetical protein
VDWQWLSQHVHLGDLPTWIAAIGALIAARYGFGQLRALRTQNQNQAKTLELQQRQLDDQAKNVARVEETQRKQAELLDLDIRERRAAQARGVHTQRPVIPWKDPGSGVENGYAQVFRVTNQSHGSISIIEAFFGLDDSTPQRATYSAVPKSFENTPGPHPSVLPGHGPHGGVPVARLDAGQTIDLIGPTYSEDRAKRMRGYLLFTDSDGRRWKVDNAGLLAEVGAAGEATEA